MQKSDKKSTSAINGDHSKSTKDDKVLKPCKELKNLDIQLCGYSSVTRESTGSDSDTDRVIKASICENVKTKARAASATFNVSGNRSPPVNSPGPNPPKTSEKTTKTETSASKSADNKIDDKLNKKKMRDTSATKVKSPAKSKPTKPAESEEKSKKKSAESKKPEPDKQSIKSQKAKTKPTESLKNAQTVETATIAQTPAAEKTIEIRTQVDESKIVDSITEAINEVVKQYKDSNGETKAPQSKPNKVVKPSKKKVLSDKKMALVESASDLVDADKGAIKTVAEKIKAKQKPPSDNDAKIDNQIKANSDKSAESKSATESKPLSSDSAAKSNDKPSKFTVGKGKVKSKPMKIPTNATSTQPKGSKIIKIDLKAKKRVKSLAQVKCASLKAAKTLENKMKKEPKVCQDAAKKNKEHKSLANSDEMSDDDNLSLTELKAQLSKSDDKSSSTKLATVVSSPAKKQRVARFSS